MRYSLATHILSISSSDPTFKALFKDVKIGGEGNALSSIVINKTDNIWQTRGYATGAWVHNKNLSRVGTAEVTISQLSDAVAKFKQCCNYYFSGNKDVPLTLTLTEAGTEKTIATCNDCYITNVPSQEFGDTAADQRWSFTCGEVNFE